MTDIRRVKRILSAVRDVLGGLDKPKDTEQVHEDVKAILMAAISLYMGTRMKVLDHLGIELLLVKTFDAMEEGLNRITIPEGERVLTGDVVSPYWCVPEKETVAMGEETYVYREAKPAVKVVAWSPDAVEKVIRLRITNGNTLQAVDEAGRCLGNLVTVKPDGTIQIHRWASDKAKEIGLPVNYAGQPTLQT